jgi:hypothetical protein
MRYKKSKIRKQKGLFCNYGYQSKVQFDLYLTMKLKKWQKLVLACLICAGIATTAVLLIEGVK